MSRRRFLVTYDITKDKVRTQLFKLLRGWGDHVQYSVFICELTARERARLVGRVNDIVNHDEDQVLFVDLGLAAEEPATVVDSIGRAYEPPSQALVV
ncbi:MAG: CRISPR-associated endonuclease Cas2 [Acidobacteriota bacterium]